MNLIACEACSQIKLILVRQQNMENQSGMITSSRFKESRDILESTSRLLREVGKGKKPFASKALMKEEEKLN